MRAFHISSRTLVITSFACRTAVDIPQRPFVASQRGVSQVGYLLQASFRVANNSAAFEHSDGTVSRLFLKRQARPNQRRVTPGQTRSFGPLLPRMSKCFGLNNKALPTRRRSLTLGFEPAR